MGVASGIFSIKILHLGSNLFTSRQVCTSSSVSKEGIFFRILVHIYCETWVRSVVMSTYVWCCTTGKQCVIFCVLDLPVHVSVACFSIIGVV